MFKSFGFAATTFLFLMLTNAAHAAEFPKGTFTNKGPDDAVWSLTFDGKGKVTVKRDDTEALTAQYKVTKDEIEFSKEEGKIADKDASPGTYKWKLDGGKLTFTKVNDASEGRAKALTTGVWEKKN